MTTTPSITRLTVRGDSGERGRAVGRRLSASVEAVIASYERRLDAWAGIAGGEVERAGGRLRAGLAERAPELLAFLDGVALGAGTGAARLLAAFAAYDLWLPEGRPAGCTTVAWEVGGDLWLAQSFDWFSDLADHMVLLTELDADGRVLSIGLAEAGLPPVAGLNRHGLAVLVNALTGTERAAGGPWAREMPWRALGVASVAAWLERAAAERPAAPLHLMLGDAAGAAAGCELGPHGNAFARPEDGLLVHTNHCVYPGWPAGADGMAAADVDESQARRRLACELLQAAAGGRSASACPQPLESLRRVFASHDLERFPRTLCCHSSDEFGPLERAQTLASLVIHPASRRTWLCSGNPCAGRFVEVPWPADEVAGDTSFADRRGISR